MRWTIEDRDEHGLLMPMALAIDALENIGCDCGTDEPGTCLYCRVMAAFKWIEREEYREEAAFWCSANLGPTNRISRIDDLEKRVEALEAHVSRSDTVPRADDKITIEPVRESTTACPPVLIGKEIP